MSLKFVSYTAILHLNFVSRMYIASQLLSWPTTWLIVRASLLVWLFESDTLLFAFVTLDWRPPV
uniref:Eukaryotic translation initiation factor isoform 4G-1 n=1 Tax=Rhizophora mucronata TaxID=61149 RepID=A0A2P2MMB2_RHIMU